MTRAARPLVVLGLSLMTVLAVGPIAPVDASGPASRWIVMLRDTTGPGVDRALTRMATRASVHPDHTYRHALRGFAASLTPAQLATVRADADVEAVVPDSVVELTGQTTPTNVARVNAPRSPLSRIDGRDGPGERVDVDVAIIDTGIQPDHPDLNVAGGVNCTGGATSDWGDGNGHGTHVAGTVGALDDGSGVVGVAPGARVWAVRVFRPDGYSLISWIICGIDWVTAQKDPTDPTKPLIEVANMSLRDEGSDDGNCGRTIPDPEHRAMCASIAAGTTYVVAAGNDRTTTSRWRPASYNEPIVVSALADFDGRPGGLAAATCSSGGGYDRDDTFADFSNYGPDVDMIAPGVCIRSTYKNSGYAVISGTSMASPAVAGGAALYKAAHPDSTPAEVKLALRAAGTADWSTGTDRDSTHEPLLDVASFGAGADFDLRPAAATVTAYAGLEARYALSLRRLDGFAAGIALALYGLPDGLAADPAPAVAEGLGSLAASITIPVPAGFAPGTYPLVLHATSGTLAHDIPLTLVVKADTTAPALSVPAATLRSGVALDVARGVPVLVPWRASDAESGVASVSLETARDGNWAAVALASTTTAGPTAATVPFGHSIAARLSAVDAVGNQADPVVSPTVRPYGYSEYFTSVRGSWSWVYSKWYWTGRARVTRSKGASASFAFTGRAVSVIASVGPTRGAVSVYVDGAYVGRINTYAAVNASRRVVWSRSFSGSGRHTVRLVNLATYRHPRFDLDGFTILR